MRVFYLDASTIVPRALDETFAFFADAGNLQALTPPWLHFQILTPLPIAMASGTIIDYRIRLHGIPITWKTRITEWNPPHSFIDEQIKGPYTLWRHRHTFGPDPAGSGGTLVRDHVEYAIPGWLLSPLIERWIVRPDLDRIFGYRQAAMMSLLA